MKYRYIAAGLVIAVSIIVTPACIEAARQYRGYAAYGGEYLIIPLGLVAASFVLHIAKGIDNIVDKLIEKTEEWEWDYGKSR